MQVKTIQEVYDWTVLFHTQTAANFFSLRDDLAEHNQMLADYFVKYEKKLAEDLVGFKAITEINTLDTYCYEYFAENSELINFTDLNRDTRVDEQAMQGYISDQHQKVINLYQYLLSRAETPTGKEKLSQLLELEHQGLKQMMQSANRHMDM
jgi:cobalamin-dependent methionine synthase I